MPVLPKPKLTIKNFPTAAAQGQIVPSKNGVKISPMTNELDELKKLRNEFESIRNEYSRMMFRLESLVHRFEMIAPKELPPDEIPF